MAKNKQAQKLFFPIKSSKLSDEVYKQIVSLISSGKLNPGDKIPSERELAADLRISRQSIREALNRAEVMGLVEVRQGEGSFILSSVKKSLKPPLTLIIEKEAERIFDFLEIRKLNFPLRISLMIKLGGFDQGKMEGVDPKYSP